MAGEVLALLSLERSIRNHLLGVLGLILMPLVEVLDGGFQLCFMGTSFRHRCIGIAGVLAAHVQSDLLLVDALDLFFVFGVTPTECIVETLSRTL